MKMIRMRHAVLAAGLASLALVAGCRSSAPEAPPENATENFVETANAMDLNVATPTEVPVTNAAPPVATTTTTDFSDNAQTMDDADATGMTAKLPQDEETQPAEKQ